MGDYEDEESEKLKSANACMNLIEECKLDAYLLDNIANKYKIEIIPSINNIQPQDKSILLQIFETNMKSYYDQTSWGWDIKTKTNEIFSYNSKFIILRHLHTNDIIAWCVFKFEWDDLDEPEHGVLFCYELQVDSKYKSLGLGKWMMNILVKIEEHFQLWKTMLTCFKCNTLAIQFYQKVSYVMFVFYPRMA